MNAHDLLAALGTVDDRDENLREMVAIHTADALTCLAAGAMAHEGSALLAFYRELGDGPLSRAAGAAAVIRYTEWDPIQVPSCATPGAIAIPIALALAENIPAYIRAVAKGYAVGVAFAQAVGGVSALPETWPGLFAAPAVAAVSASVALGLSAEETAQALALSLAASSGRNGRPVGMPSGRWFAIGEATLKGARSAFAAKAGIKGDLTLLSPAWMRAQSEAASALDRHDIDASAITSVRLKPFVSARQGMNAIQALRHLLAKGLTRETIDKIEVFLPPMAVPVVGRPLVQDDRLSTIAHLGLQLGLAAFEPERLMDVDRRQVFRAETLALAKRVIVSADDRLTDDTWPARLVVTVGGEKREQIWPADADRSEDPQDLVMRKIESLGNHEASARLRRVMTDLANAEPAGLDEASALLKEITAGKLSPESHAA